MPVVSVFLEERRGGAILCTFDFLAVHLFNEVKITRTQKQPLRAWLPVFPKNQKRILVKKKKKVFLLIPCSQQNGTKHIKAIQNPRFLHFFFSLRRIFQTIPQFVLISFYSFTFIQIKCVSHIFASALKHHQQQQQRTTCQVIKENISTCTKSTQYHEQPELSHQHCHQHEAAKSACKRNKYVHKAHGDFQETG